MQRCESDEKKKLKEIYDKSYKYLKDNKPDELTDKELEKYFEPKTCKSRKDVMKRLCGSLQNYQSMPNSIGFYKKKEREAGFRDILMEYNSEKIAKRYKDYEELLDEFIKEFKLDKSIAKRKRSLWTKYSKGILSACKFMNQFKSYGEFDEFVKVFAKNAVASVALPLLLAKEIHGMGFALGCDFLKEIGYTQYPKPDVHLITIFSELGLAEKDDLSCYKAIIKMAKAAHATPYKVDKMFWLIATRNFYDNEEIDNDKSRKNRDGFIKDIKDSMKGQYGFI